MKAKFEEKPYLKYTLIVTLILFPLNQLSALFQANTLSGESAVLSNVVIDYVREGAWHYPVHAHKLFYPGLDIFMLHPPLHYLLSSIWIKSFGIGVWQLHLQSTIFGLIGVFIGVWCLYRIYGLVAALFLISTALVSAVYFWSSTEYRPDISFGLVYSLTVLVFGILLLQPGSMQKKNAFSFLLGLLAVASLATHWFGYFVQLYLIAYALIILRKYRYEGFILIISCAGGWIAAMGAWYSFFGDDLLPSLIVVLIKGNDFITSINNPMAYALQFLTHWDGGYWLLFGLLCGSIYGFWNLFNLFVSEEGLDKKQSVATFLTLNLCAYFVFFYIFVGNKSPQYSANILFIAFPLSAIGYSLFIKVCLKVLNRRYLYSRLVLSLIAIQLVSSPVALTFLMNSPSTVFQQHLNFKEARKGFNLAVGNEGKLLVGGNTYPYLYDTNYISTLALVAHHTLDDPGELNLTELISYYRGMTTRQYTQTPYPIEQRRKDIEQFDMIALTNSGHSWQFLFYDPQVWMDAFQEVGIVVIPKAPVERAKFSPGQETNYPRMHFVYRSKQFTSNPTIFTQTPKILTLKDGTLIITPGKQDRHRFFSGESWKALSAEDKKQKLFDYLDYIDWYGADLTPIEKENIILSLNPHVLKYLNSYDGSRYNEVVMSLSLAQGVDYAFSITGYPAVFPRIPEAEWMV